MNKKIKNILLIFIVLFTCSCAKDETIMTINSDKSVNLEINLGYSIDSNKTIDIVKLKDTVSPLGYSVDSYHDDKFTGYRLSKTFDNINDISAKNDIDINFADILNGNLNDKELFKVKKGFFKNTYTANYKYDFRNYYDYKFKIYFYGEDAFDQSNDLYNYINEIITSNNYNIEIVKYNVLTNIENFNTMNSVLNKVNQTYQGIPVVVIGDKVYFGNTDANKKLINENIKNIFENDKNYTDIVSNDYDNSYELLYRVNLPNKNITTNADIVSADGKSLSWSINYMNPKNIEFSFTIFNKSSIAIIIILSILSIALLIVGYILYIKYKNDRDKFIKKNTNIDNILPKIDDNNQITSISDLMNQ